jgi:hypothetical protein
MGKFEDFMRRSAEFELLVAEAESEGLRESYAAVAKSYRRLANFIANLTTPRERNDPAWNEELSDDVL